MQEEYTLGISFSSRMLGLAIINHFNLVDYSLKLFKEKWSLSKESKMITALASCIEYYNISHIVLSIPAVHYQKEVYKSLYQRIINIAYEYNLTTTEVYKKDIRLLCGTTQKKTKRGQMEVLSGLHEELKPLAQKEVRNKNKYYEMLFDAVGVATVHAYRK
jgi:RNase H-fold protein (predicted Holliday junction resolvase)